MREGDSRNFWAGSCFPYSCEEASDPSEQLSVDTGGRYGLETPSTCLSSDAPVDAPGGQVHQERPGGARTYAEASVCTAAGPGRPPGTDPERARSPCRPDIPAQQAQHGRRHQALGSGTGKQLDATQRGQRTEGMSTDSEEAEPTCKQLRNRKHPGRFAWKVFLSSTDMRGG